MTLRSTASSAWLRLGGKRPKNVDTGPPVLDPIPPLASVVPTITTGNAMTTTAWSYEEAAKMPTSTRGVSGPLALDTLSNQSEYSLNENSITSGQASNKTSQHLKRVTAEKERLQRELNVERLAREEDTKRLAAAKSKEQELRTENQHLQVLTDANARAIERKDRKLEELKTQLDNEIKRRTAAEQREAESLRLLGEVRSDTERRIAMALERQAHAEATVEAQRDGFRRLTESHERKVRAMAEELKEIRIERMEMADQLRRQSVIHDQLGQEMGRKLRASHEMGDIFDQYKADNDSKVEALEAEARAFRSAIPAKVAQASALVQDMEETRDRMKWVMANQKPSAAAGKGDARSQAPVKATKPATTTTKDTPPTATVETTQAAPKKTKKGGFFGMRHSTIDK